MVSATYFRVLDASQAIPTDARNKAFLITDNWDDWFEFSTLYSLVVCDHAGEQHHIGGVKIGQFGMPKEQRRPELPKQFEQLDGRFFSLGQDDSYYDDLNRLGANTRFRILTALRDVALNKELFNRALSERVTTVSLLRYVSQATVSGQFARIALGGARLTPFKFAYTPDANSYNQNSFELSFSVVPNSEPPTNIHVIIGRNGVGKTYLLNQMMQSLLRVRKSKSRSWRFSNSTVDEEARFANLVSVSFSAFDTFKPPLNNRDPASGILYSYIGLKRRSRDARKDLPPKTPAQLALDYTKSLMKCRSGAKYERWKRVIGLLSYDEILAEIEQIQDIDESFSVQEFEEQQQTAFKKLSSGHAIVLLTMTKLVETVEERTLVLVDEPEAHLHPPLLSAFIRALSDLLIDRNGVAIIATHSPVILQEVPKECVLKIRRSGTQSAFDRPEIETFGENVGVLTSEIFGLEVTHSSFHSLLQAAVREGGSFEEIEDRFGNKLGSEARVILRALIVSRDAQN